MGFSDAFVKQKPPEQGGAGIKDGKKHFANCSFMGLTKRLEGHTIII